MLQPMPRWCSMVVIERSTYHEMVQRVREDLRPLRCYRWITVLLRPKSTFDVEPVVHCGEDRFLCEYMDHHWEAVTDGRSAEREGAHEACCEDSRASCVTEAQEPLQRSDELYSVRGRQATVLHDLHLVFVERVYEKSDWVRCPLVQVWESLRECEWESAKEGLRGHASGLRTTR